MGALPGLGRGEQPTERAIVEAVYDDGTCDCRVPGRPHPYTRLSSCSGRFRPHVGQTVTIAFIDYHRTGRRWMPFILGTNSGVLGSGVSTGSESRALAWHNGVTGAPDYTGSLYVMGAGYRPWKLDAGWSIPGPWDAIIGYTVDQGYILTVRGQQVRCCRESNGALAWSRDDMPEGARPVYNPARREVVLLRQASPWTHVDGILDAVTGGAVGGHTAWAMGGSSLEGLFVWGDRLYDMRLGLANPRLWTRERDVYEPAGELALAQPSVPWTAPLALWQSATTATPAGLAPYHMFGNGAGRAWGCVGMLDLAGGRSAVTDVLHGPPPPTAGYVASSLGFVVDRMSPDGHVYGRMYSGETVLDIRVSEVTWSAGGAREATHTQSDWPSWTWLPPRTLWHPMTGGRVVAEDRSTHRQSVVRNLASTLWTLPAGDWATGWGGEASSGEDAWLLTGGEGGYRFRDLDTGAVRGEWAGTYPVMVAPGVIYDTNGAGNLRRWKA